MSDLAGRIAEAVRTARRRKNLSQDELADAVGLTPVSVSNIERAKVTPTLETFAAMVEVLNLDAKAIFATEPTVRKVTGKRRQLEVDVRSIVEELSDERVRDLIILARAFR